MERDSKTWLDTAVRFIRFGPDRRAAREELAAHLEDKITDNLRLFPGMTEEEARKRALAEMGDAAEIGKALGKIHKPWLGYLWNFSRWAAWVALALCLVGIGRDWGEMREDRQDRRRYEQACAGLYGSDFNGWEGERLAVYAPNAQARLGRASVSVPRAARRRGADGQIFLYMQVRVTWDRPWEMAKEDWFFSKFQANGEPCIYGNSAKGWNWREMNLWQYEDEGRQADRVVLTYFPVPDFSLTVDLSREAEP